jgi:glyoxylate reductase
VDRTRPQVLVTRRLPQEALDRIDARCGMTLYDGEGAMARDQLLTEVAGKAGAITLLTDRIDDEFLDAAGPQLKIVANYAVGFDNIDVDACTRRGVLGCNTPQVLTETTADIAFALMMAAARRVAEGDRFLRSSAPWTWGPLMMLGQGVHHKTLGIVGFGRIGQALARRARGFAMRVLYHDAYRPPAEVEQELGAEYRDLEDLLRESDFVSLHANLTPQTRHLINAGRLAMMKPAAVLVNTSRGPVIDEQALAQALQQGQIFAAGLDVFEREPDVHPGLLGCQNAVLIPHLGSATVQTRLAMANLAVDNLLAGLEDRHPPALLNPQAWEGTVALADRGWLETGPVTARGTTSVFAGFRFPREVISLAVRWYLRYGLSYRDVEELLAERGVTVDHVTIYRWVQRFTPEFIEAARPCRHAPGDRWFVDETYLKVAGKWIFLYRAVDQHGQVIDVLLSVRRDLAAARRFFTRALRAGTIPVEVTTDRAPIYPRMLDELVPSALHTVEQYANNPIEADHGRLKARLRPMRGLKRHRSARILAAGHAFVQNLRRGHYDIATDVPDHHRLRKAFDDLAITI